MRPWLHSSHWSPISLVSQSNPFYPVLIGPVYPGLHWGTNEMGDQWVGGDQWDGGPMEWVMHGANWGTNAMGDWWVGGPMRWGTNEMGDQWDGGPLGLADDGVTNEKGNQWDGGPVIWGINEMGYQWAPIMYWGTNELGDQWEGDQWDGGPMRWGTSERIPLWLADNQPLGSSTKMTAPGLFLSRRPRGHRISLVTNRWNFEIEFNTLRIGYHQISRKDGCSYSISFTQVYKH